MSKKIYYKSDQEIATMKEGGVKLVKVVDMMVKYVRPGMTTLELDAFAEKSLIEEGGASSFKTVAGYHFTTCLCINEQAVHTRPSQRIIQKGDLLKIDIGMLYAGFHTDYTTTIYVGGDAPKSIEDFLQTGRDALDNAIAACTINNRLGNISKAFEQTIENGGYKVLKELTGHGIGLTLHEEPYVPCYVEKPISMSLILKKGLTVALEVIYSLSSEEIAFEKGDEWSIISKDKSLVAEFEKTVAVLENETILLT
jgi:methionyl aminopeptidase